MADTLRLCPPYAKAAIAPWIPLLARSSPAVRLERKVYLADHGIQFGGRMLLEIDGQLRF